MQAFRSGLSQNKDPDTYLPALEEAFKGINTEVVGNISRPRAKQEINAYLGRLKPAFQADIQEAGRMQTKLNLSSAGDRVLFEYLNGNPRDVRMNAEREMVVEKVGKDLTDGNMLWDGKDPSVVVGGAKLQMAKKAVQFGALDIAEEGGYKAGEQFIMASKLSADDKRDLTISLKAQMAAQNREIAAAKEAQQDEMARKLTLDFVDGKGDLQVLRDALDKDLISLPFHNSLRNAMLDAEKPTLDISSYIKVKAAIADDTLTTNQKLVIFAENINRLDETTRKSLVGEIFAASNPADPVNEPTNKDILSAISELENGGFLIRKEFKGTSDREIKIENLSSRIQLHNAYMKWVKENPTATPKQKREYFEETVNPYKNEAAKKWFEKIWQSYGKVTTGVTGYLTRRTPTGKEMKLESAPDVEFDKIWPKLNDEEKGKVLTALKNGYTPKDILESLGEK